MYPHTLRGHLFHYAEFGHGYYLILTVVPIIEPCLYHLVNGVKTHWLVSECDTANRFRILTFLAC